MKNLIGSIISRMDYFADSRLSLRFKIANFIMKDALRNYLAVGCLANLINIRESKAETLTEELMQNLAAKAEQSVRDIMEKPIKELL